MRERLAHYNLFADPNRLKRMDEIITFPNQEDLLPDEVRTLRYTVVELRKLDPNSQEPENIVDMLHSPQAKDHLVNPYKTRAKVLKALLHDPTMEVLVGINGFGEIIGTVSFCRANTGQKDDFIVAFAIDPNLMSTAPRDRSNKMIGLGTQLWAHSINCWFGNQQKNRNDGTKRFFPLEPRRPVFPTRIHTAITIRNDNPSNSVGTAKKRAILETLRFSHPLDLDGNVEIDPNDPYLVCDVERYFIKREDWKNYFIADGHSIYRRVIAMRNEAIQILREHERFIEHI